ncbi:AraC family transcriptional regulator [Aquincola sp. MAHUQ-54]|uniref:AraC family transcriptional regulator n=1 Tax=Aquincola agrisoli TaxID=3119538 RepID=A0AAW9QE40_9BURK
MDVLSEVLSICRSEGAVTARFELSAPWALRSEGVSGAMIRMARGAPFWITLAGARPVRAEPGDLLMLPLGAAHTIASAPGVSPVPFATMIARHAVGPLDENPLVFAHGGGGAATDMFSALVWFSAYCRHAVFGLLPPLVHIRASALPIAGSLASTMEALVTETLDRRPGWRASAARMGELLLINLLREHLGKAAGTGEGWLRGLGDPAIARAIMAIHRAPQQGWTVESLAAQAGMSRSRFSERFRTLMGATPIGYLTAHRMALAAQRLEAGVLPVSRIAEEAGYESDKVFARAFRRWSGLTPAAWTRREAGRRTLLG